MDMRGNKRKKQGVAHENLQVFVVILWIYHVKFCVFRILHMNPLSLIVFHKQWRLLTEVFIWNMTRSACDVFAGIWKILFKDAQQMELFFWQLLRCNSCAWNLHPRQEPSIADFPPSIGFGLSFYRCWQLTYWTPWFVAGSPHMHSYMLGQRKKALSKSKRE